VLGTGAIGDSAQPARGRPAASKPVTIEVVAARAGVSRQTVSNALNAPERLRPQTLVRVTHAIEELGFRPNQAARSLRTDATRVIGCRLLPSSAGGTGGVLDRMFHALCDEARSNGYDILTFSAGSDDDEVDVFDDLLRRRAVDGFVITNTHNLDRRPDFLVRRGARFVAFGRPWGVGRPRHSWVDVDGSSGTAEAVRHLAGLGHTRIAFVGVPEMSGVGDDRARGWEQTARQLRLPVRGLLARAEDGIESGRLLAARLLASPRPPTAFVCVSDAMAIGVLRAVEDRRLRPGEDVGVVGFDDSPVAALLRPGLTSVRQPIEAVARELVAVLLAELAGTSRRPARILLAPSLVVRGSSRQGQEGLEVPSQTERLASTLGPSPP
jgi:DNA-binding LacI/PurR family transcriptional regulator